MSHPVSQWSEEEEREYVLDLLRRRNILREKDNVIYPVNIAAAMKPDHKNIQPKKHNRYYNKRAHTYKKPTIIIDDPYLKLDILETPRWA